MDSIVSSDIVERFQSDEDDQEDQDETFEIKGSSTGFPKAKKLNWQQLNKNEISTNDEQGADHLLASLTPDEIKFEQDAISKIISKENIKFLQRRNREKAEKQCTFTGVNKKQIEKSNNKHVGEPSIHFPSIPAKHLGRPENDTIKESLDFNDANFLKQLHEKYYPDLDYDPKSLSWMQDVTEEEDRLEYHTEMTHVSPSAIRFDFQGDILPPRRSREIPVTEGLHHHSDAPAAAGYTIPELAHLARSRFPAQRAIAIRTLGRVLYRIGSGNIGKDLQSQLKIVIDNCRVFDIIEEFSSEKETHLGVRTYSIEALWLWQQSQLENTENG